jgi:hypothetical protein
MFIHSVKNVIELRRTIVPELAYYELNAYELFFTYSIKNVSQNSIFSPLCLI